MLINLSKICKSFAGIEILNDVTFQLNVGDRVGVVGENGTGKTTFLNTLAGLISHDSGDIASKRDLRIGYVAQLNGDPGDMTVRDYVWQGDERIVALEKKLDHVEKHGSSDHHELDRLLHAFDVLDGYRYGARVTEILQGLGIDHLSDRPASEISGGEERRMMLARIFAADPDVLLLDEPTNHLDVYAVAWLEQFLSATRSAFVIVSHDRYLLDNTVNRIIAFNNGRQFSFTGNFSEYEKQQNLIEEQNRKKFQEQQRFRDKELAFIQKNMAGQKTKQAQSRLKRLEKTEWTQRDLFRFRDYKLAFLETGRRNKELLEMTAVSIGYDQPVVSDLTRLVRRGDRIGVIGRNGTGKSTLLKTLANQLRPLGGRIKKADNLSIGYFDQDVELPVNHGTVREQILAINPLFRNEDLAAYLSRFYFFGSDLDKPVTVLSGGERTRLKMAVLMQTASDLLIMDEPTNHLDLQLKQAVMKALAAFNGSLLVISHDRFFLDNVVDEVLALKDGRAVMYPGSVSSFLDREKRERAVENRAGSSVDTSPVKETTEDAQGLSKNELMRARWRLDEVEHDIEELEREKQELTGKLESSGTYSDAVLLKEITARMSEIDSTVSDLMKEWERLQKQCM